MDNISKEKLSSLTDAEFKQMIRDLVKDIHKDNLLGLKVRQLVVMERLAKDY